MIMVNHKRGNTRQTYPDVLLHTLKAKGGEHMAKKKRTLTTPAQLALGAGINALCTLALLAAAAGLVLGGLIGQGSMDAAALAANALAVFLGSLLSVRRYPARKAVMCLGACGVYLLALLMGNLLFVKSPPSGFTLVTFSALAAALMAALLAGRPGKGRRRRL